MYTMTLINIFFFSKKYIADQEVEEKKIKSFTCVNEIQYY